MNRIHVPISPLIPDSGRPSLGMLATTLIIRRKRVRVLIDSGADGDLAIDMSAAQRLRLTQTPVEDYASSVGGKVSLSRLHLKTVRVEGSPVVLSIIAGAVIDLSSLKTIGPFDGILGSWFLWRYRAVLNYGRQTLTISTTPRVARFSQLAECEQ